MNQSILPKEIETYKRLKEAEVKRIKKEIEREFEESKEQEDGVDNIIRQQTYTIDHVNKVIAAIKDKNQRLQT